MAEFAFCFRRAYAKSAWDQVKNATLMVTTAAPAIAASGVCVPTEAGPAPKAVGPPFLAFNIFPLSGRLFVEFA